MNFRPTLTRTWGLWGWTDSHAVRPPVCVCVCVFTWHANDALQNKDEVEEEVEEGRCPFGQRVRSPVEGESPTGSARLLPTTLSCLLRLFRERAAGSGGR